MLTLGIETSCDETAIAIYHEKKGLLAHRVYSQIELHQTYGGVVPELASRDHIRKTLPLIQQVLDDIDIPIKKIDGIAYTKGPGLIGALMVGAAIGRSLGYALKIPTLGIHHMEAHLLAVMLEADKPSFPFLALIVSGGHTLLVEAKAFGEYQILGETLDDAVGEAFDKTAKLLQLPYPGGPELAKLALKGNANRFNFPRPMLKKPGLEFSFSGLKTHVMNCVKREDNDTQTRADIACGFEDAVVETLLIKTQRALDEIRLNQLVIAGGVSANKKLRDCFRTQLSQKNVQVFYPRLEFCTDNAAMVAYVGSLRLKKGEREALNINVKPRWSLEALDSDFCVT